MYFAVTVDLSETARCAVRVHGLTRSERQESGPALRARLAIFNGAVSVTSSVLLTTLAELDKVDLPHP